MNAIWRVTEQILSLLASAESSMIHLNQMAMHARSMANSSDVARLSTEEQQRYQARALHLEELAGPARDRVATLSHILHIIEEERKKDKEKS